MFIIGLTVYNIQCNSIKSFLSECYRFRFNLLPAIIPDPPAKGLEVKVRSGTSVTIDWYPPTSCYSATYVYLFYEVDGAKKEHAVPTTRNNHTIKGLRPDTDYSLSVRVQYGQYRSEPTVFKFNSGKCHEDDPYCE